MVQVVCKQCSAVFNAKPSWIKNGYGKFCSRTCSHTASRKGKIINCFVCGKSSYKQKKALGGSASGKFFCGKSCQTIWRNTEYKEEKHPNWKGGTHAYRRIMKEGGTMQICAFCKTKDRRVLAVHHLDENRKNNAIENLVWLCHNCHHLVHYYPSERETFMAAMV